MTNRTCEETQRALDELFAAGETGEADEATLNHLEHCSECSAVFDILGRIRKADSCPEPSDGQFASMRHAVLREIRRAEARKPGFRDLATAFFLRPVVATACAILLIGIGFLAGRQGGKTDMASPGSASSAGDDALLQQIMHEAGKNHGVQDFRQAQYTYDNVKASPAGPGLVALRFDVTRHVALTLPKADPLVTEVLIQTLVSPSPVGAKLQAITHAGTLPDPKVRDGLIQAMLMDPNLGVRLKAQSRLIEQDGDPVIENALLRVLQNEESVQMRLVAIDHLTRRKVAPNLIQRAIAPASKQDAVYLKAMNYLNEQGAQS